MIDFGRYQLERKLGQGGMAEVFLARQRGIAGTVRQVVIKRILPAFSQQPDFLKLFVGEAQLSMQLTHGNVVQVFDFGEFDDQYFLAMEWVDGLSLRELLRLTKAAQLAALPPPIAVMIAIELCKALHYAHTRVGPNGEPLRVVHRDVSPDNVLISWEGQVKLADFGIARAVMEGRERTSPNVFRGRFDFASPEQARSEPVDARSDLYSLGVLISEVLLGENPVLGRAFEIAAGEERAPRFPREVVDASLAATIDQCTEPLPDDRPSSAQALQQQLQAWLTKNAALATVTGLPNFLAWVAPEAVRQRGGDAELPRAFMEWLESWRPKPWARAEPVRLGGSATGDRASEPTRVARPQRRTWPLAVGVGALTALVVGLVTALTPSAAPAGSKPKPVMSPPRTPVVAVPAAVSSPAAPAPPAPVAAVKAQVEREHAGPGTVRLEARAHQRALGPTEGTTVRFDEPATLSTSGTYGFFATYLDATGVAISVRTLRGSQRAPLGARSATIWAFDNLNTFPPTLAQPVVATMPNQQVTRVGLSTQSLVTLAPQQRFTFTGLDPTLVYLLEAEPAAIVAVLRPPSKAWVSAGRTQFLGAPSPRTEVFLDQPARFTGAREVWVTLVGPTPAAVRLSDVTSPLRSTDEATSVRRAEAALASGQVGRAVGEFKACTLAFPESARCALGLGDASLAQPSVVTLETYTQASEAYRAFLELAPEHAKAERVTEWLRSAPMAISALALAQAEHARALAAKGADEPALLVLDACLRAQPSNGRCRRQRLEMLERLQLADEAARERDAVSRAGIALVQTTESPRAKLVETEQKLVEQIRWALRTQALDRAIGLAEHCLRLFPSSPNCHKLAGSAYARRYATPDDVERARRHYQRFVELAPEGDPQVLQVQRILLNAGE